MKFCAILPTYNHVQNLPELCRRLLSYVELVVIVDDGSNKVVAAQIASLKSSAVAVVVRSSNGGKGAAVKSGFLYAYRNGFTHAVQMDADGQHDVNSVRDLVRVSTQHPEALILGEPRFDGSAPTIRRWARNLTTFWTRIEAGLPIRDPMCGFRLYPLAAVTQVKAVADRMDFDPEIVVRLAWLGTPIHYVPVNVRYAAREPGLVGASNTIVPREPSRFLPFRDNALIAWMHTRLMFEKTRRMLFRSKRPQLQEPVSSDHHD